MQPYQLLQAIRRYYSLLFIVLLASCIVEDRSDILYNATYQQSLDRADVHEVGPSAIKYDDRTGSNEVFYTQWYFLGIPVFNAKVNTDELFPDSVGVGHSGSGLPLSLKYGVGLVGKGAKFPGNNGQTLKLNYLEVPLDVLYHYELGPGSLHGGLGPYFAEGIGGGGSEGIYNNNGGGGFRRFDAGLNFEVGYKLSMGLGLDLTYDLGLTSAEYPIGDGTKGHTRNFGINLSYQIGRLFSKK